MSRFFWYSIICISIIAAFIAAAGIYWSRSHDIPFISKSQHWSIGVYSGDTPFNLKPLSNVSNPVLTAEDVSDIDAEFVADPFIIRKDGKWYMFFEVQNNSSKHGDIGLASSDDGIEWTYERIVLDERFHLSYPQIFEWEGVYFMIPEAHESGAVRLYKAQDFPFKWEFQQNILEGVHLDPTVLRFKNMWWLFSTTSIRNDTLRLFSSSRLTGNWEEHPKSPLISYDASRARLAGRVLMVGNRLFRLAQDDSRGYGRAVNAFEIILLDETQYLEKETGRSILTKSGQDWNADGMHHLDTVQSDKGEWHAVVDGWRHVITLDSIFSDEEHVIQ